MIKKMKIIVKKLQGGECYVEVSPTTSILDIKKEVAFKLGVPVEQQKLVLMGRALNDNQLVQSYTSMRDGTKVNLVVKRPDGFYEIAVKYFKKLGYRDLDASNKARQLMKVVDDKFRKFSWDDIDRLAYDCLRQEGVPMDCDIVSEYRG